MDFKERKAVRVADGLFLFWGVSHKSTEFNPHCSYTGVSILFSGSSIFFVTWKGTTDFFRPNGFTKNSDKKNVDQNAAPPRLAEIGAGRLRGALAF